MNKNDIYITQRKVTEEENKISISEQDLPGHLEQTSKKALKDPKDPLLDLYQEDYQLARAIDLIHAIAVLQK